MAQTLLRARTCTHERRPRRKNPEAQLQRSIVDYLRTAAPDLFVFHVPNGGLRSKAEASRFQGIGVVAGVPDLVLVQPGGRVHFMEVKIKGGVLSAAQKALRDRFIHSSIDCATVTSIDDVRACLRVWRIETKEAA